MILKAIDAEVPEERIAKALNVTARRVRESRSKVADLSPETLEHLKDKPIADMALRLLRR
jgi:ParB-like chromosome segregation protein Spo0J